MRRCCRATRCSCWGRIFLTANSIRKTRRSRRSIGAPKTWGAGAGSISALSAASRRTIEALLPKLTPKTAREHLDGCLKHYAETRKDLDGLATGRAGRPPIHPQYLAKVVSETAAEDAIFTADVGTPTIWAARYLAMNGKRRLLGSFAHGSMANAMPQAIGAQAAAPGRQVVSLSGDGGFAMLMGDILTLRQHKLPVKIVIFNNGTLGFVEMEMKAAGYIETGVALDNPDFAAMANAIGIHARRVEDPGDLREAARDVLSHEGPALLDVVTNRNELSMPPKIAAEQIKGFSLYVMRGRDERARRRGARSGQDEPHQMTNLTR